MATRRVLVQWLGHSDLRAMCAGLTPAQRDEVLGQIKGTPPASGDLGPIQTLLNTQSFDEVRILSNYPARWNAWYRKWLNRPAEIVPVTLAKPTDYTALFPLADAELAALRNRPDGDQIELCLHLSPGTPAMAATWLLLGKTRYPATFYETYAGRSWITQVPFDLTIDVLPDLLKNPDTHLQHLAAHSPGELEGFQDIVGQSTAIRSAAGRAKAAALRSVNILLLGESGTGKELFAQAIHRASPRRDRPLVAINCAALSKTLLESELFGHVKGAFTGADRDRRGAFEQADGSTLFLDEIGECDLETQAKLLRALQPPPGGAASQRVIRRLGDDKDRPANVRVVAATNRDLHAAIRAGTFREDLYYRLATITVTLPALRERQSDIPSLARRLLDQINHQFTAEEPTYRHKTLSASTNAFVKQHPWPGNVRQLFNVLVQAAVLSDHPQLEPADLVAALGELTPPPAARSLAATAPLEAGFDLEEHLNDLRRQYLRRAMRQAKGVKAQAARLLGISNYQTLDAQLKRLGITEPWGD
jgi:DNA-binding NtrC family response regulator